MSMSHRTKNFALLAGGVGLWYVGAKVFADHHENVAFGVHDSFQHKHATAIGTVATLAGIGLAVKGLYGVNKTWGKLAGFGIGGIVAYNVVKHKQGEPLISLSPFSSPFARMRAHV
jgi:hypothetical protein